MKRMDVGMAQGAMLALGCIFAYAPWCRAEAIAPDTAQPRVQAVQPRRLTMRPGDGVHLGFSDATMARFRARVKANLEVNQHWNKLKAAADRMADGPTAALLRPGARLPDAIETLVLAYRMTGEARYANKIHGMLQLLADQPVWVTDAPLLRRDPVWHSDLGMGFTGELFGLAYDAIRQSLSAAERKRLTAAYLARLAEPVMHDWIEGHKRIHTLDTMGHNWWAHIVFGAGVGLVAIARDEPRALAYLARIDTAAAEWWSFKGSRIGTKYETFDSDGGFMESINYAELSLGTYLGFRHAWKEMFIDPPSPAPLLGKAVDFLIHNAYPATPAPLTVNFGDGNLHKNVSRTLAAMWLDGQHRPDYLWYMNRFANAVNGDARHIPRYLVQLPLRSEAGGEGQAPSLPTSAWYRGVGWATLRSSWDDNATLLAIRSGFTWNHHHADAGSFVLFHHGKALLIDSGNSSYARPEYDDYYRQSAAHNVLTFNGRAEPAEDTYLGSPLAGQIPAMLDGAGMRYVFADATGPTSANFARNFRHFLWVDGVILVYDDVKARESGQFGFQLHTEGESRRDGLDLVVTNGAASVHVRPLFPAPFPDAGLATDYPEGMRLEMRQGYKDKAPDVRVPYYVFTPPEKAERQKFLTAIIPQGDGVPPAIERLSGPDMIGVRLRRGGQVTDVMFNLKADGSIRHRNATTTMLGWETDAYMLAVTYPEASAPAPAALARMLVADGSYVRHSGTLLLDSLSKRFLIADYASGPRFWVQGQGNAELNVWLPSSRREIEVNGAAVALGSAQRQARLRMGASQP